MYICLPPSWVPVPLSLLVLHLELRTRTRNGPRTTTTATARKHSATLPRRDPDRRGCPPAAECAHTRRRQDGENVGGGGDGDGAARPVTPLPGVRPAAIEPRSRPYSTLGRASELGYPALVSGMLGFAVAVADNAATLLPPLEEVMHTEGAVRLSWKSPRTSSSSSLWILTSIIQTCRRLQDGELLTPNIKFHLWHPSIHRFRLGSFCTMSKNRIVKVAGGDQGKTTSIKEVCSGA